MSLRALKGRAVAELPVEQGMGREGWSSSSFTWFENFGYFELEPVETAVRPGGA